MDKKTLVLIGLTTALMLQPASAFANNDYHTYYYKLIQEEMSNMSATEREDFLRYLVDNVVVQADGKKGASDGLAGDSKK